MIILTIEITISCELNLSFNFFFALSINNTRLRMLVIENERAKPNTPKLKNFVNIRDNIIWVVTIINVIISGDFVFLCA